MMLKTKHVGEAIETSISFGKREAIIGLSSAVLEMRWRWAPDWSEWVRKDSGELFVFLFFVVLLFSGAESCGASEVGMWDRGSFFNGSYNS